MGFARVIDALGGTGRALLALFLAVFVLAPSFDFECVVEGLPTASTVSASVQPGSAVEHSQPGRDADHQKGVCPHGHCHHAAIAALRPTGPLIASAIAVERPQWATTPSLLSTASTRLERPPRA